MKKKYILIIYSIILLFMIMVAINMVYILKTENNPGENNNKNVTINKEKKYKKYDLINIKIGENNIKKPVFNNKILDSEIEKFIQLNVCNDLSYDIDILTDDIINITLKCNDIIKNSIYNLKESKFIEFKDLIKDEESFKKSVYNLLNLKYPKFVSNEIDIINSKYIIKNNQIELTGETLNFGKITLIINNNEIKDLMNYDMKYDDTYKNEVYSLDPNKKTIAFTFDDGPSEYDLEIIQTLKESHATATFFIVGSRINNYQRSIHSMVENNMEVGNHSYNHKYLSKIDNDSLLKEINTTNNEFKKITGKDLKLIRPPYGSYKDNIHTLTNTPIILWDVDTLDWKTRNATKIYDSIMNDISDGNIILMHSLFEATKDAVIKALPELYKRGYQVVSVSELANLKGTNITGGNAYRNF